MWAHTKVVFRTIAIVTKNLESLWVAVLFQPSIKMIPGTRQTFRPTMGSPIIVDVINTKECFFVQAAASTFPAIGLESLGSEFSAVAYLYGAAFLRIPLYPFFAILSSIFDAFRAMLQVVFSITRAFSSFPLFITKFSHSIVIIA